MNAIMLLTAILGVSYQQISKKIYGAKTNNGAYLFSAMSSLVAAMFFVFSTGFKFSYSKEAFLYSVLFAIAYGTSTLCSFLAIATGPLSLTSLVISYSTALPALYGFIVFGEDVKTHTVVGLILLLISLVFINFENKKQDEKKITLKWAVFAFLSFFGNGSCSIIQKSQNRNCDNMYKNEFMIVALGLVFVVLMAFAIVKEKKNAVSNLKAGFPWYTSCGLANGLVNLLVMVMTLPSSIMFPLISAGGIVASILVALFVYKEKLSVYQYIGVVFALPSIVLLSI